MKSLYLYFCCLAAACHFTVCNAAGGALNGISSLDAGSQLADFPAFEIRNHRLERDWGRGKLVAQANLSFGLTLNGGLLYLPDQTPSRLLTTLPVPSRLYTDLSVAYERGTPDGSTWFIAADMPGTPTLGPGDHVSRFAGFHGGDVPLSDPWIHYGGPASGVATTGYRKNRLKVEASAFSNRELAPLPDGFDSFATRVSLQPRAHWSLQASRGWLAAPGPADDSLQHSIASALYRRASDTRRFETLLACGHKQADRGSADACLWDLSLGLYDTHALFGRFEHLDGDGVAYGQADADLDESSLRLGYEYSRPLWDRFTIGFGLMQHEALAADTPDSRVAFFRFRLR